MNKKFLFLCLIIFLSLSRLNAQKEKIRFEKISIEHGLSQSSVVTIFQDHKGFLWFGTFDGLNRYDGFRFKIFSYDAADSTSLAQNTIRVIFEDHLRVLWIGTENGLSRFNRDKECFVNYVVTPNKSKCISNNKIRSIYEDHNKVLWIATENGLNKYNRQEDSFKKYFHQKEDPSTLADNYIRAVFEDSQNRFWIGTRNGLDLFDRSTGKFFHYKNDVNNPGSLSDNYITSILEDKNGSIWLGTRNGGLNKLVKGSNKFIRYKYDPNDKRSLRYNTISYLFEDSGNDLWIATYGGGLEKYDQKNNCFFHFQKEFIDPSSISTNAILYIYEDRSGIVWIGTDFGGINKFDKKKNQFIYYGNTIDGQNSLNNINTFYEDPADKGKTIWIGTWGGGFGLFNREKQQFTFYKNKPSDSNSLSNNIVRSIFKDKYGMLWIGTDEGLNRFNPKTKNFKRFLFNPNDPGSISNTMLKMIYEDRNGELWIAMNGGGLELFDRQNERFIHHLPDPNNKNSINDNIVWFIHEDNKGFFWLGTNAGGLNRFDKSTGKFSHFVKNPSNPKSISENKVLTIYEKGDSILWLGTAGGGLNRYNKSTGEFKSFTVEDGLASNTVHAIIEDSDNNLWISTTRGLSKFNPQKKEFLNFNMRDGLQGDEFHVNSFCKSITGEIFLGGINGFNIFKPENISRSYFKPQLVFTDFQLFNKSISIGKSSDNKLHLQKSISETNSITLSYQDEVFSIEFAALDFASPEKNMYAYKMEGFNNDWNFIGNRNYVTFTKLLPGKYIFRVKGSNHNGVWNHAGISLEILITPPFWETLWFRLFTVTFFISVLLVGYRIRTTRILAYNKELEQRVSERTSQLEVINKELEALSYSISHDLRAPLRAIDGYSNIILEEYGSTVDEEGTRLLKVISNNAKKMGMLIDDLLALSRVGRQHLKMQLIDMELETKSVLTELLENSEPDKFVIKINKLPNIYGDKSLIRQVLINLVSNAIKFTSKLEAPKIEIGSIESETEITYFIKDNGAGFSNQYAHKLFGVFQRLHNESEFEGTGVGLAIVQRIIKKHGGRVWAESEINKGATFYFSLPEKGG